MLAQLAAIFQGIKTLGGILTTAGELFSKWKDRKIDKHYEGKQQRRSRLTRQIEVETKKEKPSEEALRDLHKRLHNLNC